MTAIDYRERYRERLAAWADVFPPEHVGIPNVNAEFLVSLESALEELRETGRPIPEPSRGLVITHTVGLLKALADPWNEAA